jgi:hypothetical protein
MNPRTKLISIVFAMQILIINVSCGQRNAEWKGRIEKRDGVIVIKNPRDPIYDENMFSLEAELTIGQETGGKEYAFSEIGNVIVDDEGKIYVSDWKESHVKVFDKNGRYIKTIGRMGQGPGEFDKISGMQIIHKRELAIFDGNSRRMSFFSLEGEFLRSLSTDKIPAITLKVDSKGNLVASTHRLENNQAITELKNYDHNQNYIKTLFTSEPAHIFNPFLPFAHWILDENGSMYFSYNKNYEIEIYSPEWVLIKKIIKDYVPVQITNEEKRKNMKNYPYSENVRIPKFHPAFSRFTLDDEYNIFVQTWERTKDGEVPYYDVFDSQGRYIIKIPLKWPPRIWKGHKLYTIEENEEGLQVVKRYRTIWQIKFS